MKKIEVILASLMVAFLALSGTSALALSGANADEAKVKIYTEQGDDWFRGLYVETDEDGVLKVKNVLPGKYKIEVRDKDVEDGQIIAGNFRMLDEDGRQLNEETDVDVYIYIGETKILIATLESDDKGWIELSSIIPGAVYEFDVKGEGSLGKKEGKYRIKVSTKVEKSDWYRSLYDRTDESKMLTVKDVLPGKYKFKYKTDDAALNAPFTLKMRLLNDDAERIDEKTTVNLYAYIADQLTLVGTLQTDEDGWVTVPGVLTGMKYKISVK